MSVIKKIIIFWVYALIFMLVLYCLPVNPFIQILATSIFLSICIFLVYLDDIKYTITWTVLILIVIHFLWLSFYCFWLFFYIVSITHSFITYLYIQKVQKKEIKLIHLLLMFIHGIGILWIEPVKNLFFEFCTYLNVKNIYYDYPNGILFFWIFTLPIYLSLISLANNKKCLSSKQNEVPNPLM
jgi:hypothetical protein